MSDEGLHVRDIHGYGEDPDLAELDPHTPVTVRLIDVYLPEPETYGEGEGIDELVEIYTKHGPWALPPVVCLGDAGWQIAGLHRMWAAHIAGLKRVPAFIVHPDEKR